MLKLNKRKKLPRWLPALVLMLAIFGFSSIPSDVMPTFDWADLIVKKGGHMLGYGLLALSYWYAFRFSPEKMKIAWILALLYAATDEFHQSFVPGRLATVMDVGIDGVGAAIALWWAKRRW